MNRPAARSSSCCPPVRRLVRSASSQPAFCTRSTRARRIKDFYLTAEAIGEQNVDKHFDQLLAQQRELISDYFGQSAAAEPGVAGPSDGGAAGGHSGPPEGAVVRAEPPRAW